MTNFEFCRLVLDCDKKRGSLRWWEARVMTIHGEQVIARIQYYDKSYDLNNGFSGCLRGFFEGLFGFNSLRKEFAERQQSQTLEDNSLAQLVAQLMSQGWRPVEFTENGQVKSMQRGM